MKKKLQRFLSRLKENYCRKKADSLLKKGLQNGKKAFTGPFVAEIDLTERCANKCIACWVHSPLLKEKRGRGLEIGFPDLKKWLSEFRRLGVKHLHLAGAGEPLLHPHIQEAIREMRRLEFTVNLNTSLYPLPEGFAKLLTETGVQTLTVSLWAGAKEEWERMHPGVPSAHFDRISSFLFELEKMKRERNTPFPHVKIFNVITSLNYQNIEGMNDFAISHFVDEMEFQAVDIIPGVTDQLKLDPAMGACVLEQLAKIRKRGDFTARFIGEGNCLELGFSGIGQEQKEFGRFYHPFKSGFRVEKDRIFCPKGFSSNKDSWVRDHPYPALSFEWAASQCQGCSEGPVCYPMPTSVPVITGFTNLLGIGSFIRRITSLDPGKDHEIIKNRPCLMGWYYTRLQSDGTIIPCCKASNFPMGSLKEENFSSIWYGNLMDEFREKGRLKKENSSYFNNINCLSGCDNLGMNLRLIRKIDI